MITRSQWGARRPKTISHNITPQNGGVAIHYEGVDVGTQDHSKCAARVRSIQAFHMDKRGWADIAYSLLVCSHGYVFEGRGINVRTAAQGTTAGNQNYYAICFIMGPHDKLNDKMKHAGVSAIKYLRYSGHANVDVKPHRYFHATGCPGEALVQWLKEGHPDPLAASGTVPAGGGASYPIPKRTLKKGDNGSDVKWVQQHINFHYNKVVVKVDGDFGTKTDEWTRKYQTAVHLKPVDGIVGRDTRTALAKES